jgi:phenylpropionate dioxygenase-like ring-hydroxylating dioxygenase large terminal subunit
MAENFPHPIPASWYAVADSHEIAPGQVEPLELIGRKLVVFRSSRSS